MKLEFCVFGDSIGKGVVLHSNTSRYELIKFNLEKMLGLSGIRIKNYSVIGCTVSKGLSNIRKHSHELKNYKSIFLEIGGNDCDFLWSEVAENPEKKHLPKTPLAEFKRLYQQIIEEVRIGGGSPVILTLPPLEPNRFLNWVSRGINRDNIMSFLGDVNMIYRWQEMYNVEVMLLASNMSVPIIDIRSAFLKCNNYQDLLCSDGIHPNNEGYNLIYKTIAEQYKGTRAPSFFRP
jgi:lysophospholipase L1-like esterase